ncbi:uncharacterized protein BDFB_010403 [Asbolus verrucosus]|uniref:DUF3421 domain containing protein n=1 Tax=Asbolus verrucosus TaxID=1661398 RepID=A0A482VLR0_ASBVE|nr:uncharacterized protein BDFB_010403 [Asbolus verrucosus]
MSHFLLNFCVVFSLLIIAQVCALQEDYFWREYTGSIPEDAVVGGNDINGNDVYIGQAYVKNEGLVVVQIYPGVKEVYAPMKGIKKVDAYIKILCGPRENFYWRPVNSSNLHLSLINKRAVVGGHEDGMGQIGIGRVSHEGEIKIGKVNSFSPESAYFYFNDKGTERLLLSCEMLLYRNGSLNVTGN